MSFYITEEYYGLDKSKSKKLFEHETSDIVNLLCSGSIEMSLRGVKRSSGGRAEEPGASGGGGASKRRKTDQEETQWQPRPSNDLKLPSNFNRNAPEGPAELFRKDLISAMKLPDSEPLAADEYWIITDPWKQEWERGVQVPVNPDSLPEPAVTEIRQRTPHNRNEFKLPKQKYVRLTKDNFNSSEHYLSSAVARAEAACAYDMDACDAAWLRALNGERARAGAQPVHEEQLERVIEELEVRCWDKIQAIIKSEEGLGIEFDENVICDVCRSPDSEEGNEMVFCDSCNICVHQACYGITTIPSGQWLCSPCSDKVRPVCVLCPNLGGAMKCTPSRHKWAHVSCVLWIPEVSIGCAEKMEPITKISAIPASRWSLICILCRERTGACIQCSVKTCKTAYHVTCAFKYGLEMRAIIEDENADDGVKLRSYCQRHSVNSKKDKSSAGSGSDEDESKRKRRKDMTSEEKSQARAIRLHEIEAEFDRHVSIKDISTHLLDVDQDGIQYMYNYWKLKRKAGHNRPLLPPKTDETDMLMHRQEQADIDKKRMFVQLRQDLERVRNLCYMVSRREKLSRTYFKMREQTFHKQVAVLSSGEKLSPAVANAVIEANHGPSIYDRLYSHSEAVDHSTDFDAILALVAGVRPADDAAAEKDLNGLTRKNKSVDSARRPYYNGTSTRKNAIVYSGLSSGAESIPDAQTRPHTKYRRPIYSTTDEEDDTPKPQKKKTSAKSAAEKKKPRQTAASKSKIESSSDDDNRSKKGGWQSPRSRTLRQMEKEMGSRPGSGTESDELMLTRPFKKYKLTTNIYSDSEASDKNEDKSSNATSDSQQHLFRTKAAVKEFNPVPKGKTQQKKYKTTGSDDDKKKSKDAPKTKAKDYPSDLIVPQRQAAKKASENMRSTTNNNLKSERKDQNESSAAPVESKPSSVQTIATATATAVAAAAATDDSKLKPKQKFNYKEKKRDSKDESSKKETAKSSNDVFEFEKDSEKDNSDIIAYVPQRQAAKKAAEHIKSGLSKAPEVPVAEETIKRKDSVSESKKSPKDEEKKTTAAAAAVSKSASKSSSSSSSSSSGSSSSSSSSSESEEDSVAIKSPAKDRKPLNKSSLFSPNPRVSTDLPFLDEGSAVVSSSSSSSDSSFASSPNKKSPRVRKRSPDVKRETTSTTTPSDKKLKVPSGEQQRRGGGGGGGGASSGGGLLSSAPSEREKPSRTARNPVSRASARTRTRSVTGGPRNISEWKNNSGGPGKSTKDSVRPPTPPTKENSKSSKLPFAQWKTDKKLKHTDAKKDDKSTKNKAAELPKKEVAVVKQKPIVESAEEPPKPSEKAISKHDDLFEVEVKEKKPLEKQRSKSPPKVEEESKPERVETKINLEQTQSLPIIDEPAPPDFSEPPEIKPSKPTATTATFLPPTYPKRSIFSPPAIKDAGCSELFDFGNDILAVDETVNDAGFNISQGNEEIMKSTPFFGSDYFLFKEDSKEDRGVRETLDLVEKLRMKMKTNVGGGQSESGFESDLCDNKNGEKSLPSFTECTDFKKEEVSAVETKENVVVVVEKIEEEATTVETDEKSDRNEIQPDVTIPSSIGEVKSAENCYENESGVQRPECTPIPSPYNSIRQQAKWAESELIPARRSSTSSATSETSSTSHRHEESEQTKIEEQPPPPPPPTVHVHNNMLQQIGYPPYVSCAIATTPTYPQFSSEASQFVGGPVPLFPQSEPAFSLPPYQKLNDESVISFPTTCSAAFTSSSHNIALTTAMIAPLTPKPVVEASPVHAQEPSSTEPLLHDDFQTSAVPPDAANESPSKPTRTSSRNKSPKSPGGKSPKQSDKASASRRGAPKGGSRGTGRGRGRPKGKTAPSVRSYMHMDMGYCDMTDTIHTKLIGTVYDLDFDEDIANDNVGDLKSMRERRRSTDVLHERKSDSYRDASQSPKFTSPQQNKRTYSADVKELRPPTPIETLSSPAAPVDSVPPPFTNIVQPVLPGPVDMRTYSAFEPSNAEAFNNHHLLRAFESGTADQQLPELDEEVEKELHSALIASSNKSQESQESIKAPTTEPPIRPEETAGQDLTTPKVSLTDPRNQLKVKIKGPFLDANYSASCVAPVIQQPTLPAVEQPTLTAPSAVGSVPSGTSNLRRMRKKELLRQYCTQDMNMDDAAPVNQIAPPAPVASFSRNVITIPKAVASMTSIPTREDYKAVVDANMEKKRRKMSGVPRELRHLDDCESNDDKSSIANASTASQLALSYKRRGRGVSKPHVAASAAPAPTAPKLKIKLGEIMSSENAAVSRFDCQFRPPKKRLASIPKPSVEDLRKESMKFRKEVRKSYKYGKKDRKRKKRDKDNAEIHVKQSENSTTKLIIRFRKKDDQPATAPAEDPFDYDPTAPDPLALDSPAQMRASTKVSPIRLKLSRGVGGSGYVMKDSPGTSADNPTTDPTVAEPSAAAAAVAAAAAAAAATASSDNNLAAMPQTKHCEVR